MKATITLIFSTSIFAACGGGGDDTPNDAPANIDAAGTVMTVTCPATPDQTVTTSNFAFTPASITIQVNQIVKFMPESVHNVIPHPTLPSDPGLRSGALGATACLQFTAVGTFNYRCQPHSTMNGVVEVQ